MKAEIITIGDELLIGQTVDTNSSWIGAGLSLLGFDVHKKTSIHDNRKDILDTLSLTSGKSDIVLVTGGLGPTSDDITKSTICEFFNTKLVRNNIVLDMIEKMMARRGYPMNENNRRQADVPESCRILPNALGTAPGMWFEKDGTIFIFLPGVPYEMKYIMTEHVIPDIKKRFQSQVIIHRNIMTYGVPEAILAEMLTDFETGLPESIKLAFLPSFGTIKLRLTATGEDAEALKLLLDENIEKLYSLIPGLIYSENEERLEEAVGRILTEKKKTVCTVESCTGGNIAHLITTVPGSSGYFSGSVIAYENSVKENVLGVDRRLIEKEGAVSEKVVISMAENARKIFKTDFSLATSGIAGPDGGSSQKPVGTVWLAVSSESGTITEKHIFGTDRSVNITRFSIAALHLLRKQIISL